MVVLKRGRWRARKFKPTELFLPKRLATAFQQVRPATPSLGRENCNTAQQLSQCRPEYLYDHLGQLPPLFTRTSASAHSPPLPPHSPSDPSRPTISRSLNLYSPPSSSNLGSKAIFLYREMSSRPDQNYQRSRLNSLVSQPPTPRKKWSQAHTLAMPNTNYTRRASQNLEETLSVME